MGRKFINKRRTQIYGVLDKGSMSGTGGPTGRRPEFGPSGMGNLQHFGREKIK